MYWKYVDNFFLLNGNSSKMCQINKNLLLRWSFLAIIAVSVVFPREGFCVCFEHEHKHPVAAEMLLAPEYHDSVGHDCQKTSHRYHHCCFICCDNQTALVIADVINGVSFKRSECQIFSSVADCQPAAVVPPSVTDRRWSFPFVPLPIGELYLSCRSLRI